MIRKTGILLFVTFIALIIFSEYWFEPSAFGFTIPKTLYFVVVLIWILLFRKSKNDGKNTLVVAFILLMLSFLFTTLGVFRLGESLARISLLGWILGLFQALLEYRRK